MSDLLGHIASHRALADAFECQAQIYAKNAKDGLAEESVWQTFDGLSAAHAMAAETLEEQARADCSGPAFDDRPQPPGRRK